MPDKELTPCYWRVSTEGEGNIFETSCGELFECTDGTPDSNKFRFCCWCGKRLEQQYDG